MKTFFVFVSVLFAVTAFASDGASRKLASIAPENNEDNMGQGEQMLLNVKRPTPYFLSSRPSDATPSSVHVVGVCQDAYGYRYNANQKGYGACMDATSNASGSSVNDYFGPAQRQTAAGLGFRVGE